MDELMMLIIEEAEEIKREMEQEAEREDRWAEEEAEEAFPSFDW